MPFIVQFVDYGLGELWKCDYFTARDRATPDDVDELTTYINTKAEIDAEIKQRKIADQIAEKRRKEILEGRG